MPDERGRLLIPLQAGAVRAALDGVDLRTVGLGVDALLDRVYVAVRAADWSTVPGVVADLEVESGPRVFRASFVSQHRAAGLDFVWRGRIEGTDDGVITCDLEGEARSDFEYCRIGFCVHHPDRLAGAAYVARTAEGEASGRLPRLIAPQILRGGAVVPPIPHFDRLRVTSEDGGFVVIESAGEPFEFEDQRNWTDASFKSYIPPIRPGYPYRVRSGQRFAQRITIRAGGPRPARVGTRGEPTRLQLTPTRGRLLPSIGLGLPDPLDWSEPSVLERIARLRPDHLRLSAWIGRPDVGDAVDRAVEQAQRVGCSLEIALFMDGDDERGVRDVISRVGASPVTVVRWMAFEAVGTYRRATDPATAALARRVLDECCPGAVLAVGTASDFVWLNRNRPAYEGVDALAWAVQPSGHADDDRSIMENAMAQGVTVETARDFAEGRRLCVGPVELTRRPRPADPRQQTPRAAAWMVASLADLCAAAPDSVTYFETVGPRGVLAADGEPYPVCAVFESLAPMRGGTLRTVISSARRAVVGLAVECADATVAIVANITSDPQRVVFHGLDSEPPATELGPYELAWFR